MQHLVAWYLKEMHDYRWVLWFFFSFLDFLEAFLYQYENPFSTRVPVEIIRPSPDFTIGSDSEQMSLPMTLTEKVKLGKKNVLFVFCSFKKKKIFGESYCD